MIKTPLKRFAFIAAGCLAHFGTAQADTAGALPQLLVSAAAGVSPVPLPAATWLFLCAGLPLIGISLRSPPPRRA